MYICNFSCAFVRTWYLHFETDESTRILTLNHQIHHESEVGQGDSVVEVIRHCVQRLIPMSLKSQVPVSSPTDGNVCFNGVILGLLVQNLSVACRR